MELRLARLVVPVVVPATALARVVEADVDMAFRITTLDAAVEMAELCAAACAVSVAMLAVTDARLTVSVAVLVERVAETVLADVVTIPMLVLVVAWIFWRVTMLELAALVLVVAAASVFAVAVDLAWRFTMFELAVESAVEVAAPVVCSEPILALAVAMLALSVVRSDANWAPLVLTVVDSVTMLALVVEWMLLRTTMLDAAVL